MFEKFLVLIIVLFCSIARGEMVNIEESEENKIQKFLDEKIDFNVPNHEVRWGSYHTFLAQDPNIYEEYLEGVLNGKYKKKPFDYERAMELAMYYLGFDKNVFYSLCWDSPIDSRSYDVPNYFLKHPRNEIRDLAKARYWLEKADFLAKGIDCSFPLYFFILSCKIEGIIDVDNYDFFKQDIYYKEERRKKSLPQYEKYLKKWEDTLNIPTPKDIKMINIAKDRVRYFAMSERINEKYVENNYLYDSHPIIAYAYYKGIGVEANLDKAKEYIYMLPLVVWRIFWVGWIVPKDQEFAKHILKLHGTPYSKAQLKRIESGFYDER